MQTLKTAVVVVLLFVVFYGVYEMLNRPPDPPPGDVAAMEEMPFDPPEVQFGEATRSPLAEPAVSFPTVASNGDHGIAGASRHDVPSRLALRLEFPHAPTPHAPGRSNSCGHGAPTDGGATAASTVPESPAAAAPSANLPPPLFGQHSTTPQAPADPRLQQQPVCERERPRPTHRPRRAGQR